MTRRTLTRVSTLSKVLDDAASLFGWKQEQALRGIAMGPDLQALLATMDPKNGSKQAWRALGKQAEERAAAGAAANMGTAIHSAVASAVEGASLGRVPADVRRDAEAVLHAFQENGLTVLSTETFVVNQLMDEPLGGSFDHLVAGELGAYVLDLKTTSNPDSAKWAALSWATQISCYAHGRPYIGEVERDRWTRPVIEDVPANYEEWPQQPSLTTGIVACIVRGSGHCDLLPVDLTEGWKAAHLAVQVRAMRKTNVLV